MTTTRFSIDAIFKAIDKFSAPVARMTTRMGRFTRTVKKGMVGMGRQMRRVARGMKHMVFSMATLGVMGAYAFKGLLGPAVRFEQAVAGINSVTRDRIRQEGRLGEIRAKALDLGKDTIYTAVQVANAMEDLARAGLTTNEVLGGIQPILHAAGAEGSAIEDVSKVIISTMKAFDKEMNLDNTTKAADSFANVAASAKTNILSLAEGVSKFAPVAHMFGFAMEDTIAFVAALQDVGIEASMSGTQMKTMFSKLSNLSPKARKEFKLLGIDVKEALELGDGPRVIRELMEGLDRATSKTQKVRAMTAAFGQRGMIAGMLLAASQGKKSKGLLDLLNAAGPASGGAAKEIYGLRQDTTAGALRELVSAWEYFRIEIGTAQLPVLTKFADGLAAALRDSDNIAMWAEQLDKAVAGLTGFWSENKKEMKDLAATSLRTVEVLAGVVGIIADLVGGLFNFGDSLDAWATSMNDSAFGKAFNQLFGLHPDNVTKSPGVVTTVLGLPPSYSQEKDVNVAGTIVIKDPGGNVAGYSSEAEGMSIQLDSTRSGANYSEGAYSQ